MKILKYKNNAFFHQILIFLCQKIVILYQSCEFIVRAGCFVHVVFQPCQQLRSLTGCARDDLTGSADLSGLKLFAQNLTVNGINDYPLSLYAILNGTREMAFAGQTVAILHSLQSVHNSRFTCK